MTADTDFSQFLRKTDSSPQESIEDFSKYKRKPLSETKPLEYAGRKFLTKLLRSPKDLADILEHGSKFFQRKGEELAEKEGRYITPEERKLTDKVVGAFGYPSRLLEKYPSEEDVEKSIMKLQKFIGIDPSPIEPQHPVEKFAATTGGAAGQAALGPLKTLPERLLLGSEMGAGAGVAEALGGEEKGKLAGAILAPILIETIKAVKSGKFNPSNAESKELYEYGKKAGFTERELSPLLKSNFTQGLLSKVARKTKKITQTIEDIDKRFGDVFSEIKDRGAKYPKLDTQQNVNILTGFKSLEKDLSLSKLPTQEKQFALDQVKKAASSIETEGLTIPELIDTYRDLNKVLRKANVPENAITRLKNEIKETFKKIDPEMAIDFNLSNKLYSKFKNFEKEFSPNTTRSIIEGIASGGEILELLHGLVTGNFSEIAASVGVEAARRIASNMLINPRWSSMHKAILTGLKNNDPKLIAYSIDKLHKEMDKSMPKQSKEIDWKDLEKYKRK
jgi:hypothetical protein